MHFDKSLIEKYNKSGPRYTSYPTANNFSTINEDDYKQQIVLCNQNDKELSLYIHIPFCDTICFYCGCNKIATKDTSKTIKYLEYLYKEIKIQAELFSSDKIVRQCHFGGGTPTFLNNSQLQDLANYLQQEFNFAHDCEFSIEIDPRSVDKETFKILREVGFNRLSFGVQDFDSEVQNAINRPQSFELVREVISWAREYNFLSLSFDLIYGLPKQNLTKFKQTLKQVEIIKPDRISLFNYAHLPTLFKPQRRISEDDLPDATQKVAILEYSINFLTQIGYKYIGMDHFALPEDELSKAQNNGSLYRNFQGYATFKDCDMIGFGVSSIGQVENIFSQNFKTLDEYYLALDNNKLPINKGQIINADDNIRKAIIMQLICNFDLEFALIENEFKIDFKHYFAEELAQIQDLAQDNLLTITDKKIIVSESGKFFIRPICMVFDNYLKKPQTTNFSKVL
jgi:oxygen-independent coproporphyrinogen-3 oxidase